MKLPKLSPERWFPSLTPRLAAGSPDGDRDRFQPMYFSSRSGGGDGGGFDDDDTIASDEATETPARSSRNRTAGGRGSDGGRQRTIQFQPDDRYWTEYLRIALPIIGLILMLGLFWYWATLIIGDDGDNTSDPVEETPPGLVQTTEATDVPATQAPTQPVENTPEATEPAAGDDATEPAGGDNQPTEESSGDEPTEEPADEEPTEEASAGGDFAADDVVVVTEEGDGVNVRSEPSTSGDVVDTLTAGTELIILGGPEEADEYQWYEVTASDGSLTGWVASEFIEASE